MSVAVPLSSMFISVRSFLRQMVVSLGAKNIVAQPHMKSGISNAGINLEARNLRVEIPVERCARVVSFGAQRCMSVSVISPLIVICFWNARMDFLWDVDIKYVLSKINVVKFLQNSGF